MGWFNLGFLDNADHKDLKPGPAVGAADPRVALKRRERDAEGGDASASARTADAKSDDKPTMSQSSFSGYK